MTFNVGASVGWKDDYERYGRITGFAGGLVIIEEWDSQTGQPVEHYVSLKRLTLED